LIELAELTAALLVAPISTVIASIASVGLVHAPAVGAVKRCRIFARVVTYHRHTEISSYRSTTSV